MIVIEGMDNSGKTTLAQNLLEHFQLPNECYIHSPGPDEPFRMASRILEMTNLRTLPLIWDRIHCISDQIYSKVLCRTNWFNSPDFLRPMGRGIVVGYLPPDQDEQMRAFELCFESWIHFLAIQPTVIYCRPPLENILQFGDREQMDGVRDRAALLTLSYDTFMGELANIRDVEVIHYDWTDSLNFVSLCNRLNHRIRNAEFSHLVPQAVEESKKLTENGFFNTNRTGA